MRATLIRRPLDARIDPWRAALLLRDDPRPFALTGAWAGGGAVLGSAPVRELAPGEDPFAALDELPALDAGAPPGAMGGGWFGSLRFGVGATLEDAAPAPPRPVPLPASGLAFYDHVLRLDPAGAWWFEALITPEREAALAARAAELEGRLAGPVPEPRPVRTRDWGAVPGAAGHAEAVRAAVARITGGDVFQVNGCRRLEAALDGDLLDLWSRAAAALRSDRAAWLGDPAGAIASLSPELFLAARDGRVLSAPIKGTRRRPRDPAAAARAREELVASAKDRAENVMIVDLVRNDLGRVCAPGSIAVRALARPEAHPGLWHLVSEVEGRLRPGAGNAALLRATFPPGSVTGAPKLAALDVIAEIESTGREAYTGAIGFASPVAGLELSVAIRTFEAAAGRIWLGTGGGIVADSDPAEEARETQDKAAALLAAIGAPMPEEPPRDPAAPRLARRGPRPLRRPDPAAGVFETLLVRDGRAVALDQHLARLTASTRALWRADPPGALRDELVAAARRWTGEGRVRVDATRGPGGAIETDVTAGPLPPGARDGTGTRARAVTLPGGLGAHKWRDRALLDAITGDLGPGEVPVLVDLDGLVLEASRAAVVIREGGRLLTPPRDGRVLPSVTVTLLAAAAAGLGLVWEEAPLPVARVLAADEILLSSALRMADPVVAWDGEPRPVSPAPVAGALRAGVDACT